jgi:hypothetical protein
MMAKAPKPLADSVAETLLKKKTPCWWTDIPESVYRDVEAIKAKWLAGEYRDGDGRNVTAHALSQAIAKSLNERKISTVGRQGVLAWLKRTNP